MTKQKTITFGLNRPIRISLPDKYWDILFAMSQMEGTPIEELAARYVKQIIIEDIAAEEFEGGYWGYLITKGWKETLKGDPYYEGKE